jgi:uncharacterized membrane protein
VRPTLLTDRRRIESVDLLRGVVMVVMALDHARDFFSDSVFKFDPTDLSQTTPALFITRWVTHFCAPVFVFLAGTSAYLWQTRGRTKAALTRFLLTRGIFLLLLDPTIIRFTWFWDTNWRFSFAMVLWVTGWSMIILAALIRLPRWVVAALAIATIAGHNLLDGIMPSKETPWGIVWRYLHARDFVEPLQGFHVLVMYPIVPWFAVLAAGYALGPIVTLDARRRRLWLLALGLSMIAAFIALRGLNLYGDPRPWTPQKNALFTFFSFLNCEKYPPSLSFLLMTLGPALTALAIFDRSPGPIGRWFAVFGRVPLFFYLLHAPLLRLLAGVAMFPRYGWGVVTLDLMNPPSDFGFSLPIVYAAWIGVVLTLYFPCRWYAGVKQRRRDWWLSYL